MDIHMEYPNLLISGSTFFGHELTYIRVVQDSLFFASYTTLAWIMQSQASHFHLISSKSFFLFGLAFTFRLVEDYPFDIHLGYDILVCGAFCVLSWLSFAWLVCVRQTGGGDRGHDNFWLHMSVGITAGLAYVFNYSHLTLTLQTYCWALSHYLEGAAFLPQFWLMYNITHRSWDRPQIPKSIWLAVNLMSASKAFQLLNWIYMHYQHEMLDWLAVLSALCHLTCHLIYVFLYLIVSVQRAELKKPLKKNVSQS